MRGGERAQAIAHHAASESDSEPGIAMTIGTSAAVRVITWPLGNECSSSVAKRGWRSEWAWNWPLPGRVTLDHWVDAVDEGDVNGGGEHRIAAARAATHNHQSRQRGIDEAVSHSAEVNRETTAWRGPRRRDTYAHDGDVGGHEEPQDALARFDPKT